MIIVSNPDLIVSEKLEEWRAQKKGYLDICKEVLALFVTEDEIPRSELDNIVERSFEDFNKRGGEPVPMVLTLDCAFTSSYFVGECWPRKLLVHGNVSRPYRRLQGTAFPKFILALDRILLFLFSVIFWTIS